jgi:cell division protein FtsW (lipid II flippase)
VTAPIKARSPLARYRRNRELSLGVLALIITAGGYVLLGLSTAPAIPPGLVALFAVLVALFGCAHLAVRRLAPRADATILPIASLLLGLGFVMLTRLDLHPDPEQGRVAPTQAVWIAVGVGAFIATLLLVRNARTLSRYKYTFLLLGVGALLLPLVPGLGATINGARLWIRIGGFTIQPGEMAKVLLVIFFAAYLVEKRELLSSGSRRLGRLYLPDPKHLGPLLVPWALSILIMVQQKDLGSSLLFFAVFMAMLYIATRRSAYVIAGGALFAGAVVVTYQLFAHVQDRVTIWLDPWQDPTNHGFQITQSLFAFGSGGFTGKGIGRGIPFQIPVHNTDFIFAAIGEELGLIGTVAVIGAFMLLVGSAYRIALQASRPFTQLFAAGLATSLGVQTFVIIGGITRVIPLTGVTLPFVSYGGSSLIASFVILALLLRISDESAAEEERVVADAARLQAIESAHA